MDYTLFDFPEGRRLIHVNELTALHDYKENEIEIHRARSDKKKIIVGTVKPARDAEDIPESFTFSNSDFAYLIDNRCNLFKVIDIRMYNDSFVALIQGELNISKQPIAAFQRINELSIRENVIQRSCLLSLEHEIAHDQNLTKENWLQIVIEVFEALEALQNEEEDQEDEIEVLWGIRTREKLDVMNSVFQQDTLFSESHFTYHLTHTYDKEPRKIILTSTIEPYTMDLLIAYIQFVASDIDMQYSIDQEEIKRIVKELYSNHSRPDDNLYKLDPTPCEIDLYINWEWWCGQADSIMSYPVFHNDRLQSILEEIIHKK
ncbi:hypothetical protein [Paenibacillus sp. Y412MC10]|uniref:hypothetical protein n=1 Tax=Geobacillus sp. (strain Y412MC10) TaxID=481743 RepID=UPI0011A9A2DD|nr:hypothetical protein [Paenibacillus sp. Y412MC10]